MKYMVSRGDQPPCLLQITGTKEVMSNVLALNVLSLIETDEWYIDSNTTILSIFKNYKR